MIRSWLILTIISLSQASPTVFLPINAQAPPVARVEQPFNFQFAQSTFTSSLGSLNYTISSGPEWLQLNGENRTFFGTPTSSDAGSFVADLVASDGSGSTTSMPVTFVVSTDGGPGLGTSIADQLSTHDGFSSPDSLLLPHSTALALSFSSDTFTNTNGNTLYYALSANNTPLPSWLNFDPKDLSFSGTAPLATSLAELPTTYVIKMTASDVAGFSGAAATFSIVVESHLFAFGCSVQMMNVTASSPVNFTGLQTSLALNKQPVNSSMISSASASAPTWLSLDPKTLALTGIPPSDASSQNFTVNVTDIYGDTASTMVWIQIASLNSTFELLGSVPTLSANNGSYFVYELNRTLTDTSANIEVHLGDAWTWLSFDSGTLELKGQVPGELAPQQYMINVTASLGSEKESQILTVQIHSSQTSSSATASAGSPTSAYSDGNGSSNSSPSRGGIFEDNRWIALPVVLPIAALTIALILFCCFKRRKQKAVYDYDSSNNSSKHDIVASNKKETAPILEEATIMSGGLNAGSKRSSVRISRPPYLDIPGVWKSYTSKRNSQFRASQASTDGGGRASRADSWHRYTMNFNVRPQSTAMQGAAAAIAEEKPTQEKSSPSRYRPMPMFPRFSVSTRSSPTHGYSRSHQTRSNMSFGSSAVLSSNMSGFGIGHGRSIPSQSSGGMLFGAKGIGHGDGGGPPGYGTVRDSWRNFRLMHLRSIGGSSSSDGEIVGCILPTSRPMGSSSPDKSSIRLVMSNSNRRKKSNDLHRRSTIKTLSTVRSSSDAFRRDNHSQHTDPLLEFHRRRLLLKNTSRALFTAGPSEGSRKSSRNTKTLSHPHSKNQIARRSSISILPSTPEHRAHHHRRQTSHSESEISSNISPLHSSPSKSSRASRRRPQHLRHNTYSTGNGIRLPLIGREGSRKTSIMSDDQDSRWESASSDAQSMDPYIYSREVNNGHRETSLFDTQSNVAQTRPPSNYGMERFARSLRGLSWQRAEREGSHSDEEEDAGRGRGRVRVGGEAKGKMLARSAGMAKGEPGNKSFRGDIRGLDDDGASAFV